MATSSSHVERHATHHGVSLNRADLFADNGHTSPRRRQILGIRHIRRMERRCRSLSGPRCTGHRCEDHRAKNVQPLVHFAMSSWCKTVGKAVCTTVVEKESARGHTNKRKRKTIRAKGEQCVLPGLLPFRIPPSNAVTEAPVQLWPSSPGNYSTTRKPNNAPFPN